MRFCIDRETGDLIRGWVAPDNPFAISRVAVSVGGKRVAEIAATEINAGVRQMGWHATGECEFIADETKVPGLPSIRDLEIYDVDTNLLIHRRSSFAGLTQSKLILLNTGINPEATLEAALFPYFNLNYYGAGRFSEQIIASILDTPQVKSLFVSGSFVFPRYEGHITVGELTTALLVHDPFVEMASRLIWLRDQGAAFDNPLQRWRLGAHADAVGFARAYDYANVGDLRHFLRMLPKTAYDLLYNPLTRQLGTLNLDDQLLPGHSVLAVEALARIGVVGHSQHFEAFAATLFDRLGIAAPIPAPPPVPPETLALASRLSAIKAARDFVIFDVAISDGVQKSVARSWSE